MPDQMLRNKKRRWTGEEDQKLLALAAAGRSNLSIAAAMKRSKGAVSSRLSTLRLRTGAGAQHEPCEHEPCEIAE
jgi:DNA-binding NarL/FixJ family response regulator